MFAPRTHFHSYSVPGEGEFLLACLFARLREDCFNWSRESRVRALNGRTISKLRKLHQHERQTKNQKTLRKSLSAGGLFSQASLSPGEVASIERILRLLDEALADNQSPPHSEADPTGDGQTSPSDRTSSRSGKAMSILSFSEIRSGSELESQFRDNSKRACIRNW